ncbi:MAG TPA: universal stress protein, partial [Nevskiaceae bacterium]|nr:universal stress protein [Nevskiaceae bacterium]
EALIATPVDLTEQLRQKARMQLDRLCQRVGVPLERTRVLSGPVPLQILDTATELGADLIVVGHAPRRGWLAALFSHTDQSVVSRAPCDVLALKLPEEKT